MRVRWRLIAGCAISLAMTTANPATGSPISATVTAAIPSMRSTPAGTELYGYLPYWEMNATMAAYLPSVPLTTIGLFSVTATAAGGLQHGQLGYRRITGQIGARLIAEAHARGQRVEIVFSSFGWARAPAPSWRCRWSRARWPRSGK